MWHFRSYNGRLPRRVPAAWPGGPRIRLAFRPFGGESLSGREGRPRSPTAPTAERCVTMRYEDLLSDPEMRLERLTRQIGLAFSPEMLRFHVGKPSNGHSAKSRWLPITRGLRDWQTAMADEDVAVFELLAGDALQQFGYPLSGRQPSPAARDRAARLQAWWQQRGDGRRASPPSAAANVTEGGIVGSVTSDRVVVQGSPDIPGLERLLQGTRWADRWALDRVPPARAAYVRLKPQQNCLVGYQHASGQWWGHAVAYRRDAQDKLQNAERYLAESDSCPGFVDPEQGLVAFRFPHDPRLPQLRRLFLTERARLPEYLSTVLPQSQWGSAVSLDVLSYKPQRRCVLRVTSQEGARAVLRCYLPAAYESAHSANKHMSGQQWYAARRLGHSDRHHILAHEWLDGRTLSLTEKPLAAVTSAGEWLARLHAATSVKLPVISPEMLADRMRAGCQALAVVAPSLATRVATIEATLATRIEVAVAHVGLAHGDFHRQQILMTSSGLAVVDWDHACVAPPGLDLACFVADHMLSLTLAMARNPEGVFQSGLSLIDNFFAAYEQAGGRVPANIWSHIAAQLLQCASKPFRQRWVDWPEATSSLLRLAELCRETVTHHAGRRSRRTGASARIERDRLARDGDSQSEWLDEPLRVELVEQKLAHLEVSNQLIGTLDLSAVRVEKHVPERRCLLRYEWDTPAGDPPVRLLGKIRRKRLDVLGLAAQRLVYDAVQPDDGWRVAEPVAVVPAWNMWLQSVLPGETADAWLTPNSDVDTARRIGKVLARLHGLQLRVTREHTWDDEYSILADGLQRVAEDCPAWSARIARVLASCGRRLAALPIGPRTGIHRDFYPAQVLATVTEIGIVDFDLFSMGHPAVDVGNFVAHLIEAALRLYGDADVLNGHVQGFIEGYLTESPAISRDHIEAMTLVSLARHICIAHRIRDRKAFCQSTLELCEERLLDGISHHHQRGLRVCHE